MRLTITKLKQGYVVGNQDGAPHGAFSDYAAAERYVRSIMEPQQGEFTPSVPIDVMTGHPVGARPATAAKEPAWKRAKVGDRVRLSKDSWEASVIDFCDADGCVIVQHVDENNTYNRRLLTRSSINSGLRSWAYNRDILAIVPPADTDDAA